MLRPPFSQEPIPINNWDVIVIGAGAAGLMTCLELPANLKDNLYKAYQSIK